jgi:hypothetical protein
VKGNQLEHSANTATTAESFEVTNCDSLSPEELQVCQLGVPQDFSQGLCCHISFCTSRPSLTMATEMLEDAGGREAREEIKFLDLVIGRQLQGRMESDGKGEEGKARGNLRNHFAEECEEALAIRISAWR